MSIKHEHLFTTSRHSWVSFEFSTEMEKVQWMDVPTHISDWLTNHGTWLNAQSLANRMAQKDTSVSDLDECLKWFVDHAGHCFTYYYLNKHPYGNRWRMTKKPFVHKSHNWYAKGLASTIQENQFFVNKDVFDGGAINMDNATLTDWYNSVLTALPQAKYDFMSKKEQTTVNDVHYNQEKLAEFNTNMSTKLAELDIHKLLKDTIEETFANMLYWNWDTHPLAKADDFVATLKSDYMKGTDEMSFDEYIEKVNLANAQIKQLGASVFTNMLAIETAKTNALASIASLEIPTQESEEE